MNEPFTVAGATEYYDVDFSKLEAIEAARQRLDVANHEFMTLAQTLLAERALGSGVDVDAMLDSLEDLYVAKRRAEEAFRAAHE